MASRKRKTEKAYPRGILTEPYLIEYAPSTARAFSDEELERKYPGLATTDEWPLMRDFLRHDTGEQTEPSKARWNELLEALAAHLGVDDRPGEPSFWQKLATALMRRHVPALQASKRASGRPKKASAEHLYWLRLYAEQCEAMGKASPDSKVHRAVARKEGLKSPGAAKDRYRRAIEWRARAFSPWLGENG